MSIIHARETIATPMILLADMLLTEEPGWLASFLRLSCMEGEESAARMYEHAFTSAPRGMPKGVRVDLGSPVPHADGESVTVAIHWSVRGYRVLPERFDGTIVLRPGPGIATAIEISGKWQLDPAVHADFSTRLAARAASEISLARFLVNLRIALEEAAKETA